MSDSPPAPSRTAVVSTHAGPVDAAPWDWRTRHAALVVGGLYTGYQLTNHWHWRPPAVLSLTPLDRAIPLLEWTVWPYLVLAGCVGLVAAVRGRGLFLRAMRALLFAYPINLVIFVFWPTTYPRVEIVPGAGLTHQAFAFLFAVDTPANCFPSGHITAPFIGFWAVARENPRWRHWLWGAFVLLCPTILTTKQHFVVDLLGGIAVGMFGVWASGQFGLEAAAAGRVIPRPRFNLGIANFVRFQSDPLRFIARLTAECGTVATCRFVWLSRTFVNDPVLARGILELPHTHANKATRSVRAIARIAGESVLTTNGEIWSRLRRMVQPAFHRQQIGRHVETMVTLTRDMLEDWRAAAEKGQTIEVAREMRRLTFRFICKALFGADPSVEIASLERCIVVAMDETWKSIQSPTDWALSWSTRRRERFRAALAEIDAFVARLIAQRRDLGVDGNDLLAMLLATRKDGDKAGLTDEEIRNECVTLMIAGYDTTSNALTWALLEIARDATVGAEVAREVSAAASGRRLNLDDLPRLRWSRAVFLEALRLYPPIWILERNLTLPLEVDGWSLPAGTQVLISPWMLHRLPSYWNSPDTFEPRRFLGAPAEGEENPAFLPFGAGPRSCIGRGLAMLEGQVFLAVILQAGTLALATSTAIEPEAGVSLRPRGEIRVRFSPRV